MLADKEVIAAGWPVNVAWHSSIGLICAWEMAVEKRRTSGTARMNGFAESQRLPKILRMGEVLSKQRADNSDHSGRSYTGCRVTKDVDMKLYREVVRRAVHTLISKFRCSMI